MKNNKLKKIILISVPLSLLLLLIGGILLLFNKTINLTGTNNKKAYLTGTKITNTNLDAEQCINNVCISNVVVYWYKDQGKIEYDINNKNATQTPAYFKLVFKNNVEIPIFNNEIAENSKINSFSQYLGEIKNAENTFQSYTLKKMTELEYSEIRKDLCTTEGMRLIPYTTTCTCIEKDQTLDTETNRCVCKDPDKTVNATTHKCVCSDPEKVVDPDTNQCITP